MTTPSTTTAADLRPVAAPAATSAAEDDDRDPEHDPPVDVPHAADVDEPTRPTPPMSGDQAADARSRNSRRVRAAHVPAPLVAPGAGLTATRRARRRSSAAASQRLPGLGQIRADESATSRDEREQRHARRRATAGRGAA